MNKYTKTGKSKIIDSLNQNRIVAIGTGTIYGLIAKATKDNERKINEIIKRNPEQKISIIFPNKELLDKYLYDITYYKKEYMSDRLPGKYTFIVKLRNFSDFNREDFGVRITTNNYLQDIIKETGPVLLSSCNLTGNSLCANISKTEKYFKNEDIDIVEEKINFDKASTIISLINDIEVIRE